MKNLIIIIAVVILFIIAILAFINNKNIASVQTSVEPTSNIEQSETAFTEFSAKFNITTNGTVRTFTNPDYHNLSESVYIEAESPNTVIIKEQGITWDEFFKTLPFTLSKDCLATGTGQTFCTGPNGTLRFFVNGVENPNALDAEIMPNDNLEVVYGN